MTPQQFIAKWGPGGPSFHLNERQGAQAHFIDLCQLLDVPTPGSGDAGGTVVSGSGNGNKTASSANIQGRSDYVFERDTLLLGEARGFADVFYRDHFAWENKAPGRNLDAALKQLLGYSLALSNPPLLVVCDRLVIRIHTQFNGHPSETHTVLLAELDQPEKRALLRRLWTDPESFRPRQTSRDITEEAARSFATLADLLRRRGHHPDKVAHFLTQCLFCFFAEDVGLLPGRMFERMVGNRKLTSERLTAGLATLFTTMSEGGLYGADDIPWFNGGLFKTVDVPKLEILDITELRNAADLNWSAIDVSIFGTLFERGLDPAKRSQLGAHYTDPATIDRIIGPVVARPLLAEWHVARAEIEKQIAKRKKHGDAAWRAAHATFIGWLDRLRAYRVLDPACGSGNFLFMALKTLKDIEHLSHTEAATLGLDRETDLVTGPHNVLGIELNEFAAELARVTVWIGELQWRIDHGYEFKVNPVLEPLDHIECRDALLTWRSAGGGSPHPDPLPAGEGADTDAAANADARARARAGAGAGASATAAAGRLSLPLPPGEGRGEGGSPDASAVAPAPMVAEEAIWPKADAVVGNPPFLGDKWMRAELGDGYTQSLRKVYAGRVPGGADLVCYWFERARACIAAQQLTAAGFVATNSIRQRANRSVIEGVLETVPVFEAWSDCAWVNEGAAVRVSLLCFGDRGDRSSAEPPLLDGQAVQVIHADLKGQSAGTASFDLTTARPLAENADASFFGLCLAGPFKVPAATAAQWLREPNPHGKPNSDVLKPIYNGSDVTGRWGGNWVIDFGARMEEGDASLYEKPFDYAKRYVQPVRATNREAQRSKSWWRHGRARPELRAQLAPITRYIATVETAKHRLFVTFPVSVAPEHKLVVIPRSDDLTFGLLSSRIHCIWATSVGGKLGVGNDPVYTTSHCFARFPFPPGLTPADTAHQQTETLEDGAQIPAYLTGALREAAARIARAAHRLDTLRRAWLNPPEWTHAVPEVIPLGMSASPYPDRIEPLPSLGPQALKALSERTLTKLYNQRPAWLDAAHRELDKAVAAAYALGEGEGEGEGDATKGPAAAAAGASASASASTEAVPWSSYSAESSDDAILARLLAMNLERAAAESALAGAKAVAVAQSKADSKKKSAKRRIVAEKN